MTDLNTLKTRMAAEFSAHKQKVAEYRTEHVQAHKDRQQRLERLEANFDLLRDVWKPRLESLAEQFKDIVKVTPTITPGKRQAKFQFDSPLARIVLRVTAWTDSEIAKVVLAYDLDILPIYMEFEKHAEIEYPIDQVNEEAVGKWLDDRIVSFVKTYLALYENEYYLKDHLVEDPIAHVRFPKFVAGATVERAGKTVYFISEETRREYENSQA